MAVGCVFSFANVAVEASGLLSHGLDAGGALCAAIRGRGAAVLASLFLLELQAGWAESGLVFVHGCLLSLTLLI